MTISKIVIAATGIFAALSFSCLTASSQDRQPCAIDHDALVETVETDPYNEKRLGAGIASNGNLIELYVNEDTGTWTVFASLPSGPTCLIKDGRGWVMYLVPGEPS